jgi:hypothetical protein
MVPLHYDRVQSILVSKRAHGIADWLIHQYEIQPGFGLAYYLKVSRNLNNHDAVRLWVQLQIRTRPPVFQTLGDLRKAFAEMLPVNDVA